MTAACAFIGLGANLGEAQNTLAKAIDAIGQATGIISIQSSSFYRSDPVDAPGPAYVNAAAKLSTTLAPLPLLDLLRSIESQFGRERHFRNAPRTLDLDLLLYDSLELNTPRLTVPHPRMHLRAFVLKPLIELGQANTCVQGKTLADWLAQYADQACAPI